MIDFKNPQITFIGNQKFFDELASAFKKYMEENQVKFKKTFKQELDEAGISIDDFIKIKMRRTPAMHFMTAQRLLDEYNKG